MLETGAEQQVKQPVLFKTISRELELRFLQIEHAQELFTLTLKNREHLRTWLPWVSADLNIEHSEEFLRGCELQRLENRGFHCGIYWHGALVGVLGFHAIDWNNRKSSLGYWLAKDLEGRGIMTRSVQAMVDFSFEILKLNRMEIRCASGNAKSQAIPKRLGFKHEGVMRQVEWLYDKFVDHEVYCQLRDEWKRAFATR